MRLRLGTFFAAVTLVLATPRVARSQEALHGELGVGHAMGQPQAHELGWGGELAVAYELRFGRFVGVELGLDVYGLPEINPPVDKSLAQRSSAIGFDGQLGVRLRPLASLSPHSLWIEASGGAGETGAAVRAVVEARLGYDFGLGKQSDWALGPFVGYNEVFQPSDTLRPQDAHLLWVGLHVELGVGNARPTRPDRDGDGVFDDEDACPDVKGVRTTDPKTNGCPPVVKRPDRDGDGIPDDEDACPDVPGVHSDDPKANGCPDRDHDGVPDKEDACPEVPGVRTSDPKTNGCPLPPDRDKDGVLDDVDACPDVPGVHTEDPKTNGCPPATDLVRVEGDQILLGDIIHFDTGSPRVRHASWPLVQKLAEYFAHTPDIEEVDIEGYADDTGTSEYNLYLSRERAAAVKQLLLHFGVDGSKLTTHAYGETRPREAGHDEKARRENRRVEFTITRARAGTTPAQPVVPNPANAKPAKPNGGA